MALNIQCNHMMTLGFKRLNHVQTTSDLKDT